MSRMTKFLKQTCLFSQATRNENGDIQVDKYGEVLYQSPVQLKCRRERTTRDIQTNNGAVIRVTTRYFLDEAVLISTDDKLDGSIVKEVEEYINQLGKVEGFECYV